MTAPHRDAIPLGVRDLGRMAYAPALARQRAAHAAVRGRRGARRPAPRRARRRRHAGPARQPRRRPRPRPPRAPGHPHRRQRARRRRHLPRPRPARRLPDPASWPTSQLDSGPTCGRSRPWRCGCWESYGLGGRRDPAMHGVFTAGGKIASLGVHVSRGVTRHGIAFNARSQRRALGLHRSLWSGRGAGRLPARGTRDIGASDPDARSPTPATCRPSSGASSRPSRRSSASRLTRPTASRPPTD